MFGSRGGKRHPCELEVGRPGPDGESKVKQGGLTAKARRPQKKVGNGIEKGVIGAFKGTVWGK